MIRDYFFYLLDLLIIAHMLIMFIMLPCWFALYVRYHDQCSLFQLACSLITTASFKQLILIFIIDFMARGSINFLHFSYSKEPLLSTVPDEHALADQLPSPCPPRHQPSFIPKSLCGTPVHVNVYIQILPLYPVQDSCCYPSQG